MARPLRIDYPGAFHHIFFRGNRKERIFEDRNDRIQFLEFTLDSKRRYGVKVYAYCLMNNHVHLLIESGPVHIGNFMRVLLTNYVQYFNRRWNHVGHLLQDRYKSILVDKDSYLLTLIKYIHLNPVRKGLCKLPEEYIWSSHIEYLGLRDPIVNTEFVLSLFKDVEDYNKYINEGEANIPRPTRYRSYKFYGDDKFINKALNKISLQRRKDGYQRKEISYEEVESFMKNKFSKSLRGLIPHKDTDIKRTAVVIMRDRLHWTLKKVSDLLGVSTNAISYLYRTSDKNHILGEFDEFCNL
ncbi:transposase [candidate division WOR-3 bacterium]|nr:transposase [candidate division WOR-3 bacterium]